MGQEAASKIPKRSQKNAKRLLVARRGEINGKLNDKQYQTRSQEIQKYAAKILV